MNKLPEKWEGPPAWQQPCGWEEPNEGQEEFTNKFLDRMIEDAEKMTTEEYLALHKRSREIPEPEEETR